MKYSTLNLFTVKGKVYKHVINTRSDATYLLDADDTKLYTVSSDGYMFDCTEEENFIGVFRTEYSEAFSNNRNWYLDKRNGVIERHHSCDLLHTERQVFKNLLVNQGTQ